MKIELSLEEAYILLQNLQAREQWLKDNPEDSSELPNERGHLANILIKLRDTNRDLDD